MMDIEKEEIYCLPLHRSCRGWGRESGGDERKLYSTANRILYQKFMFEMYFDKIINFGC